MKFLFFIVFSLSLYGQEIRGFVTEDNEGHLFLVDTPAVRSCCVKKSGKAIQLIGNFGHLSRYGVVSVNGRLIETSDGLKLVADGFTEPDFLTEKVPTH